MSDDSSRPTLYPGIDPADIVKAQDINVRDINLILHWLWKEYCDLDDYLDARGYPAQLNDRRRSLLERVKEINDGPGENEPGYTL